MNTKARKTVFVGLSGGVDSSVAALRLKNQGYDVVGVFIRVWQPAFLKCNWEQERLDAMRVAAHLKIPFLMCDAQDAYRQEVGEYFIREYERGRVPNPDVMCNQHVKFGAFLDFAMAHGADYIATGHYASIRHEGERTLLVRGVDGNKDQSYFLWTLSQEVLKRVLLPIGVSTKDAIRQEALLAALPTATKKDSQGVCFLGHIDIPEFLSHFVTLTPGAVLDTTGDVIGSHRGALVYTLGQRHGFTITKKHALSMPYFVIDKDLAANTITVAHVPRASTESDTIALGDTNWIATPPLPGDSLTAAFRYRQTPIPVTVVSVAESACVIAPKATIDTPASGQSCVFYADDVCVGGGIIS